MSGPSEGFVMSAENKRVGYFKQGGGKMDAEGKSLSLTPTWVEKAAPITGEPALTLTSQPPALRAEFADPKMAGKVTIDLSRGDLVAFAKLKPASDLPGRPTRPPSGKTSTSEAFKLPANVPPAKPFAVLDTKQYLFAMAVSPDGKRVALGSQQTLDGKGFTADLAVWDIESQKQLWIKKKMVAEKDLGIVRAVAFSGD